MKKSGFTMALSLSVLLFSGHASATLGEKNDSIKADRAQLRAKARSQTASSLGYVVDESTSPSSTIRQYYTSDGTVFAITWDGISQPDLSVLLGSFNERYVSAAKSKMVLRGSRRNETAARGLVVRKSGHMRAWHGQIIATDLVPAGVIAEDLP